MIEISMRQLKQNDLLDSLGLSSHRIYYKIYISKWFSFKVEFIKFDTEPILLLFLKISLLILFHLHAEVNHKSLPSLRHSCKKYHKIEYGSSIYGKMRFFIISYNDQTDYSVYRFARFSTSAYKFLIKMLKRYLDSQLLYSYRRVSSNKNVYSRSLYILDFDKTILEWFFLTLFQAMHGLLEVIK